MDIPSREGRRKSVSGQAGTWITSALDALNAISAPNQSCHSFSRPVSLWIGLEVACWFTWALGARPKPLPHCMLAPLLLAPAEAWASRIL